MKKKQKRMSETGVVITQTCFHFSAVPSVWLASTHVLFNLILNESIKRLVW